MSVDNTVSPIKPGSPEYWGPRLWRVFHNLAEISDRRDIGMLWSNVLKAIAATMPCAKCREHLSTYLKTHTILRVTNPLKITGPEIRQQIRNQLLHLHNLVNARNAKPLYMEEDLDIVYGDRTRTVILSETQEIFNEVKALWTPLLHSSINPADFTNWKHVMSMLISLLTGGTY